ncbi:PDZ domain-containing protein [Luteolibacter soli]|uniref:PDZ domain-containing protein n=1 Tax=Luteolibacter soli TaxID=3135280 RepID=A0ABU9AYM3_9BACT
MIGITRLNLSAVVLASSLWSLIPAVRAEKPSAVEAAGQKESFKEVLFQAEYDRRVARLDQSRLDPAKVAASKLPDFGVIVNDVTAGSQADKAGLKAGWIIDKYNGEDQWNHRQRFPTPPGAKPRREVEAVSPDGERKTFQFEAGLLGFNSSNAHRPEQYLLRQAPRGAWDRDMLVAVQAWHSGDRELLETALAQAVKKGMPANSFSRYYGAILSLDRGDQAGAKSLLDQVLAEVAKDGEIPRFYRSGIRTLALGMGDYALLRKGIAELDGFREELQAEMIGPWEEWAKSAPKESLVSRIKTKEKADLLPSIVTVKDGWERFYRIDDPAGFKDGTHFAQKPLPDYDDYCFAPEKPVKDVVWEIRGGYGDIQAPGTFNEIAFYLVDLKKRKAAAEDGRYSIPLWTVAGLRLRNDVKDGRTLYLSAGINPIEIPTQRSLPLLNEVQTGELVKQIKEGKAAPIADRKRGFVIQLIRLGKEAEVVVNGVPYLRLPVDPSVGELGCVVHSAGMAVAIDGMKFEELK